MTDAMEHIKQTEEIRSLLQEFDNYVYIYSDSTVRIDGCVEPPNLRKLGEVLVRLGERWNRATHKRITLVGEGELAYCEDCKGGEVELFEQSCEERRSK